MGMLLLGLLSDMTAIETITLSLFIGAIALITMFQLQAVIRVEQGRLSIVSTFASFSEKLENLNLDVSEKFLYRTDAENALNKFHFGTRILGFYVGWFTLNDGSVAFACVSRKRHARAISTKDGVKIVLDPGLAMSIAEFVESAKQESLPL